MGTLQNSLNKMNVYVQILQKIADHFHSVVTYSTMSGIIRYVSPNSKDILQYEQERMVGKKISDFLHENDWMNAGGNRVLFQGNGSKYTMRIRKGDGTYIWVNVTVYAVNERGTLNQGGLVYVINKLIDHEDSLLQNDKLSLFGQLAAGIVHDIRNPLTSLKGFIQLMKSEKKYNSEYLRIMETEMEQIDAISKELMIFAKPTEPQFTSCILQSILYSCLRLLEGQFFQKRIKVETDLEKEPIYIVCDEQRLRQVLINLMKNAIEAMDKPGKITMKVTRGTKEGIFEITDEGSGIPEELIGKLGQPFFTTKNNGNGLGLMMCYKIIEEHAGRIEVESKEGEGTTFRVYLPLAKKEKANPST
ncbi:ATP-binding protein [Fervidibacillus halotolerans]|uniref:histidine kinase n=1 Tax=Fervidibacillus halotolerans TaxID=2980027 RepID=A0A9E8RYN3_9BACI|nr:ATP-binding protein [Fervidibacillus halotolerans]WAA12991.1 ATP-binding protein [Fervidibacillus halotolerans]